MEIIDDNVDFSLFEHRSEWHKVKPASTWTEKLVDRFENPDQFVGDAMPWSKINGFRLRESELTIWAGPNGQGKSLLLSHVMLHMMALKKRVFVASMEMNPVKTMERMAKQATGSSRPTSDSIRNLYNWTDGKMWIYDHIGQVSPETMLAVLRYVYTRYKPHHCVIDSLMKCGIGPEDYARQKAFLNDLTAFAMETGTHIHLVAHTRKGEKETDRVDKYSIKGSSEITDQADNVVLIQRNLRKERDKDGVLQGEPDSFVSVAKQRHGDWEGTAGLWYHAESQSFLSSQNNSPYGIGFNV